MEAETSMWTDILYSWGPVLLMIGLWFFFAKRFSGPGSAANRSLALMEKQMALLERIALALEERNRRRL